MSIAGQSVESLLLRPRQALPEIPGYRVHTVLGRGGMGVVYAAQHCESGQLVAIKLLRADIAGSDTMSRFNRERRILARLDHPDIARLLDAGETADHTPFLVMEYVEGQTVVDYCETRGLDLHARLRLFHKVCCAVAAAHQRKIIHRDLKPANILVTSGGRPKLLDFGIAKLASETGRALTANSTRWLTPEYASVEQIRGRAITAASDVYSLGVILSELRVGGDARLSRIIARATAERAEERYASATGLADDVEAYLEGRAIEAQPASTSRVAAVLALVLAIVLLAGGWIASDRRRSSIGDIPSPAERDYLVARHLWNNLSVPELRKAEMWFRKAVTRDPRSALGYAGLADALYFLGELGGDTPRVAFANAKQAARRAVQLDGNLAIAHVALASALLASDRAWEEAEREFQKALRLDPRSVRALQGYGCFLMRAGRLAEARAVIQRARLLDPASPILGVMEARISFYDRQYAVARDQLRAVIERDRGFMLAHFYLALCQSYLGQQEEAEHEMKRAELSPLALAAESAWLQARAGRPMAGLRFLGQVEADGETPFLAGELRQPDRAFAVLEKALAERWPVILSLRVDPRFDCLRADARFPDLLRRAGFDD